MTAAGADGRPGVPLERRIEPRALSRLAVDRIGGMTFLQARLPGLFRAAFTTRLGGASGREFASLNLDPRSSDDPEAVASNRARVAKALEQLGPSGAEMDDCRLVSPAQVHGLRVVGAAEYMRDEEGTPCDGLTLHPLLDRGLAALLLFADCVPVVLAGEVDMAVAHGGWRGVLGGIVQQAGRAMTGPPAAAVIGPSIGPCCFTVGREVAEAFANRFGSEAVVRPDVPMGRGAVPGSGNPRVDLWAVVAKALGEVGLREEHVVNPRLCTACNADLFYSYRVHGPVTGRHGCVAWTVPA